MRKIKESTIARWYLGLYNNQHPVQIIEGYKKPELIGDGYGWETRGGRKIYHPSAYSRKGWSNMVYKNSTFEIVVGKDWFDTIEIDRTSRKVIDIPDIFEDLEKINETA